MEPYEYVPLENSKASRLLVLLPGESEETLRCRFATFQLFTVVSKFGCIRRHVPKFQALSYVWGSHEIDHVVECDGRFLPVSENLHDALKALRRSRKERILWVDALCINQADLEERKAQIGLMRSIYQQAAAVIIHMRPEHSDMSLNQADVVADYFASFSLSQTSDPSELPRGITGDLLASFFDNSWFSRVWVIQEVAQSKRARVHFGNRIIPWEQVLVVATFLLSCKCGAKVRASSQTNGLQNVAIMNNCRTVSSSDPIPVVLQLARSFKASDARDKVFAMLQTPIRWTRTCRKNCFLRARSYGIVLAQGMALGYILSTIAVLSPIDTHFWAMLGIVVLLGHHLCFLSSLGTVIADMMQRLGASFFLWEKVILQNLQVEDTLANALSMTADYSLTTQTVYRTLATKLINRTRRLTILSYVQSQHNSLTSNHCSWVPQWDVEPQGTLILASFARNRFNAAAGTEHMPNQNFQSEDHLIVEGVEFSRVSEVSDVLTKPDLPKMADVKGNWHERAWYPTGESASKALRVALTAGNLTYGPECMSGNHSKGTMRFACHGRRQFVTKNGYVGIGPANMQNGDLVCVLFGGCVPYVLRTTDTSGILRLVGESYVRGIMQGEVIDKWRDGSLRKQLLTIC